MSGLTSAGFLACLAGAVAMGMSCGTGCSPAISLFLSNYVIREKGNTGRSLRIFLAFFIGKAAAVLLVCSAAAIAGKTIVDEGGYFGQYSLKYLMPAFLILTGLYMLNQCRKETQKEGCGDCHGSCRETKECYKRYSPLLGGFFYGLTPCAPLILLAGYALTMPVEEALLLGFVFSCACMVSPLIFILLMVKLIAGKMHREVPGLFGVVKWVFGAALAVVGIVSCFTGIEAHL